VLCIDTIFKIKQCTHKLGIIVDKMKGNINLLEYCVELLLMLLMGKHLVQKNRHCGCTGCTMHIAVYSLALG
jgi:hypothetical protein